MAETVKRLSTMQETRVQSLGQEDPLEKEMDRESWQVIVDGVARVRHDLVTK